MPSWDPGRVPEWWFPVARGYAGGAAPVSHQPLGRGLTTGPGHATPARAELSGRRWS